MTTDKKSKFSTIGMVLGALALLISVTYFWTGPSKPEVSIEERVAEKIVSIRDTTLDRLMGKAPQTQRPEPSFNEQRLVIAATSALGCLAIIFAVFGFTRRESARSCISSAMLGIAVIAFPFIISAINMAFTLMALVAIAAAIAMIFG
ncbi:hypothetical protein [Pectobacterium wasabiae]|uniref:Membrane protein n=1 Tax=Pectobacterium wasabiae TaxID=55208 RepID=A0AAW3EL84_9GAMM|nr:hypothetical protein [Pectobacterium wasabiae]AOR64424.1 hypothetical protein A7983_14420 [Pectobacterium wasabiae CFBP 3304]EJS92523.1 Inner membrane protein yidI [Pectobacterium wasabiae CFBP 3304]KFX09083.1 membrane protein [Pectobacterium wasabiae]KGA29190.1 membrane protein [Pectobacterium wasabiae]